jgi:cytidine deaminase
MIKPSNEDDPMSIHDHDPEALIHQAMRAFQRAYAPYSEYHVGAAVLTARGDIYTGCNIENAVYPLSLCAERVAIFKAVSEGATHIHALAVVTDNGGPPCGSCRQVMQEFGDQDTLVYIANTDGAFRTRLLKDLLPESFSAADLIPKNHS